MNYHDCLQMVIIKNDLVPKLVEIYIEELNKEFEMNKIKPLTFNKSPVIDFSLFDFEDDDEDDYEENDKSDSINEDTEEDIKKRMIEEYKNELFKIGSTENGFKKIQALCVKKGVLSKDKVFN